MLSTEFRAMNTDIVLVAEGQPALIQEGFSQAQQLIDELEARFTRFSDDSELSQLNRSAGKWFPASHSMLTVMQLAQDMQKETQGLFNPAILPALEYAGYNRSMDELRLFGPLPSTPPNQVIIAEADLPILDYEAKAIYLWPGMQIDLGGIAKGWIAEQAAQRLDQFSEACAVNAGGDMVLIGLPLGDTCWEIGLEDPRNPAQDLCTLQVEPGAVATSSITKRQWRLGDQIQHHLIDPRSGQPAQTDWLSVTVWAERAVVAEAFAKALLIAGSQQINNLFTEQSLPAFLAVDSSGKLWGSDQSLEVFHVHSAII